MNPPFGTRRKGADMEFLRTAFQVRSVDVLRNGYIVDSELLALLNFDR
jgi:predicted RNA methylase